MQDLTAVVSGLQTERVELRKAAEADKALQERASISVPLVEEKQEDIAADRKVAFTTGSSRGERKRKRLEIGTQSVFGEGGKQKRQSLMKVCSKMGSGVLHKGGAEARTGAGGVQQLRNTLGIRTAHKS